MTALRVFTTLLETHLTQDATIRHTRSWHPAESPQLVPQIESMRMAIAPDNFWQSNYYGHPSLTNEMVEIAERQLGIKLPAEYIALLRIQNGGYTRGFGFPMTQRTTWAADHVPLNDLSGIVTDPELPTAQNILQTAYMTAEWGLPPRQAMLSGDGHWWITLDYRKGDVPSVAWIDVECGQDIQVSPSFVAFLEGLRPSASFDSD